MNTAENVRKALTQYGAKQTAVSAQKKASAIRRFAALALREEITELDAEALVLGIEIIAKELGTELSDLRAIIRMIEHEVTLHRVPVGQMRLEDYEKEQDDGMA